MPHIEGPQFLRDSVSPISVCLPAELHRIVGGSNEIVDRSLWVMITQKLQEL